MADIERLKMLRMPFEPHQMNMLPKPYDKNSPKGKCKECGGYHGLPAAHLKYVGHAALTDRLLDVDVEWNWEPFSVDAKGLPQLDSDGGLWIRLTICGVTRIGYGDAQGKTGTNATKELIGDSLRNAGMRFGAALELWHKGELHLQEEEKKEEPNMLSDEQFSDFSRRIKAQLTKETAKDVWKEAVKACSEIGDTGSASMLKEVLLKHAEHIENVKKKEMEAA